MTGNFQCLQMPSVRIRQGMAVSSLFLFLYGECVYQSIEMYILAYLVHMYKCQSTSLSKDAYVRDGDELKSPCMCVNVCMFALKIAANHDLAVCFVCFIKHPALIFLNLRQSSQVKRSSRHPNFPSRATPALASLRNPPYHPALQPQHPILLFSEKYGAWVAKYDNGDNCSK